MIPVRRSTIAGSNPILHFPNIIGYASTQHILALYGNPRTPLLPDHYQPHYHQQQQQQQQQGTLAPHQQLQSRLSGLLSPAERYTKTLSNGDLRNHHHIGSTLAGKFDFGRQTQPTHGPNRRACSTLDISDHHRVTQRQLRHSGVMTSSSARPRNAFNFENVRSPLNLSTNDVVYWRHGVTLIMWR